VIVAGEENLEEGFSSVSCLDGGDRPTIMRDENNASSQFEMIMNGSQNGGKQVFIRKNSNLRSFLKTNINKHRDSNAESSTSTPKNSAKAL